WDVKLAPGVHQIGIHRDGYKNYLTHIELSAGEDHPVKLALEPLGGTVSDGTLSIVSNPPALDVMIDGAAAGRTPTKQTVSPGSHTVVMRRNGADVWRKTVTVEANEVTELRPRIPAERPLSGTAPAGDPAAAPQGTPANAQPNA